MVFNVLVLPVVIELASSKTSYDLWSNVSSYQPEPIWKNTFSSFVVGDIGKPVFSSTGKSVLELNDVDAVSSTISYV